MIDAVPFYWVSTYAPDDGRGGWKAMQFHLLRSLESKLGAAHRIAPVAVLVFGSNHIGELNLLREYGRVVEPNTPAGWQAALMEALENFRNGDWGAHHERTRAAAKLRSIADAAKKTLGQYRKLTEPRLTAKP